MEKKEASPELEYYWLYKLDMESYPELIANIRRWHEPNFPMCDSAQRLINLYTERTEAASRALREAETALDQMPDEHYSRVLRLHYVDGLTWERVAEKMNYSVRQIHRLKDAALEQYMKGKNTNV